MEWKMGPPVLIGERVSWVGNAHNPPQTGTVRWMGKIPNLSEEWCVGVELDKALLVGGSNGFWDGRQLFKCHSNHGLIVPINEIQKVRTGSSSRQTSTENQSDTELDESQVKDLNKSNKNKHKYHRYSSLESKLTEWTHRNRSANRRSGSPLENQFHNKILETLHVKHHHILKPKIQDCKLSLKKKRRKRNSSQERIKRHSKAEPENDALERTSSQEGFEAFENAATLDSKASLRNQPKNMNEVAGYFKEIKEDDSMYDLPESSHTYNSISESVGVQGKDKKFFSFLKWFKKNKNEPNGKSKNSSAASSPMFPRKETSSCESIDTLFSTQTVRSFAYIPPTQYQPSAPPSSLLDFGKSDENLYENDTPNKSYSEEPEGIYDKRKKRKAPQPPRLSRENSLPSTLERKVSDEDMEGIKTYHRRTVSESFKDKKAGAYCHVQGKKKAPLPPTTPSIYPNLQKLPSPTNNPYPSLYKKKKPAPPPPDANTEPGTQSSQAEAGSSQKSDRAEEEKTENLKRQDSNPEGEEKRISSNQSSREKLTKDVSLSPLPSRPWYKRTNRDSNGSGIIKKDLLKGFEWKKNKESEDWMPEVGFSRKSISTDATHNKFNIFSRLDKNDDKKKEEKRKSQISILTNISELDREAAEIVRKEQAQEKKMMEANDARYYSNIPGFVKPPESNTESGETPKVKTPQSPDGEKNKKYEVPKTKTKNTSSEKEIKPNGVLEQGVSEIRKTEDQDKSKTTGEEKNTEGTPNAQKDPESKIKDFKIRNRTSSHDKETKAVAIADPKLAEKKTEASDESKIPQKEESQEKENGRSPIKDKSKETSSKILADVTNSGSTNQAAKPTGTSQQNIIKFKIDNKEVSYLNEPWVCNKCTLENPGWRVFCEICGTVKTRFLFNKSAAEANKAQENTSKNTPNEQKEANKAQENTSKNTPNEKKETPKPEPVEVLFQKSPTKESEVEDTKKESAESLDELRKRRMEFFKNKSESPKEDPKPQPENIADSAKGAPKAEPEVFNEDKLDPLKKSEPEITEVTDKEELEKVLRVANNPGNKKPEKKKEGEDAGSANQTNDAVIYGAIKKKQQPEAKEEQVAEAYVITKTIVLEDIIVKKGKKGEEEKQNVVRPPRTKKVTMEHAPEAKPRKKKSEGAIDLPPVYEFTKEEVEELTNKLTQAEGLADFRADIQTMAPNTEMNTVAVNRLLRKLEIAINKGDDLVAAGLAKELAMMKVNCSVTRHKADSPESPETPKPPETPGTSSSKITIDLYIEDKQSHQGPIPIQVSPAMTLHQLKNKIQQDLRIPTEVQRWILGKRLATDDDKTLAANGVSANASCVFLYLVAPEKKEEKPAEKQEPKPVETANEVTPPRKKLPTPPKGKGWYYNYEEDHYSYCEDSDDSREPSPENKNPQTRQLVNGEKPSIVDLKTRESENEVEKELKVIRVNSVKQKVEQLNRTFAENSKPVRPNFRSTQSPDSWKCVACTFVNSPGKFNCSACSAKKIALRSSFAKADQQAKKDPLRRIQENQEVKTNNVHYKALMELQDADLVPNAEPFNCSVCLVDYAAGEGVTLKDCLHTFCRTCLISTVQFSEDAEVKCPYLDDKYSCTSVLQQREIKALVPKKIFDLHLAKSVKEAENKIGNAFHCKTPDCKGWCIYEDNVNEFHCPVCKFTNCLTCQAIHTGINCRQYQERMKDASETDVDAKKTREMLEEMVEKGEAMACPKCQVVLMKKWGCDWLRCSMCKTEICWVTRGFRWGPGGKGDTSGGCKCGINGVKCHPKCNYCH